MPELYAADVAFKLFIPYLYPARVISFRAGHFPVKPEPSEPPGGRAVFPVAQSQRAAVRRGQVLDGLERKTGIFIIRTQRLAVIPAPSA